MTQVFTPEGNVVPVTVIEAGPCVVLQKKDIENDGYEAIQIGYSDKKEKMLTSQKQVTLKKRTLPLSATFVKFAVSTSQNMKLAKN